MLWLHFSSYESCISRSFHHHMPNKLTRHLKRVVFLGTFDSETRNIRKSRFDQVPLRSGAGARARAAGIHHNDPVTASPATPQRKQGLAVSRGRAKKKRGRQFSVSSLLESLTVVWYTLPTRKQFQQQKGLSHTPLSS